uniref:Modulator of apoptosis 1 n=1 Tax=Lygus hesperus TaxID=30085 RepID=A0A0A9Y0N5_LYGHE
MGSCRKREGRVGRKLNEHTSKTFDGSGLWEEFIFQFQWRSRVDQWTDVEKAGHLVDSLRGQALSLICVLGDSVSVFDDMVAALEKRYSCRGQEQNFMCQLRTRHQKSAESLTSFAVDLEILTRRALPGVSNEVIEKVALQQFYDGVRDDRIRESVVASSSTSLCDALFVAMQVEARLLRANMFHDIVNRRVGMSPGGIQRKIPYWKWKCSKCGKRGHLRSKCPWRSDASSNNNLSIRAKSAFSTFKSKSLPEAATEEIQYGMIVGSKAPSAPDSVGIRSVEDNVCSRSENSGCESGNDMVEGGNYGVTLTQVESTFSNGSLSLRSLK